VGTYDDSTRIRSSQLAYLTATGIIFISAASAQAAVTWHDRTPPPGSPLGHAMVYDSARGVTVLYSGGGGTGNRYTAEWDGTSWRRVSVNNPPVENLIAMAYDSTRGVTVLFGGYQRSTGYSGETWEWDGTLWTQVATTGPSARGYHAMVYDSARDRIVMFGGRGISGYLADTWEWDGSSWTQVATTGPGARRFHEMAYDSSRGVTVLFGGYSSSSGYQGDTWGMGRTQLDAGQFHRPRSSRQPRHDL
jgi:hypothetical protein